MASLFWFILFSIFIFGLICGSFLNCVIFRFGANESALRGRSHCPKCKHQLSWIDLLPLVSFLVLKAKCRYCKKPISWQYPAVELATGILFAAAAWFFAPALLAGDFSAILFLKLAAYWLILAALAVVFVADWRWYLIPDGALAVMAIGALILQAVWLAESYFLTGNFEWQIAIDSGLASFFAGIFFLAVFLAGKGKWLGFGDVKFAFLMGLTLGFGKTLLGLFAANFFGAIIGLSLIIRGKKKMSSAIPFGPFLVAGMALALFFGESLIGWYLSIIFF